VRHAHQRLVAIRDFMDGKFAVDGSIEPFAQALKDLDGKRYADLPDEWQRRFDQFTLRIFKLIDYQADEPGELFYRLNQPTNLTAAEQRNAFFGPARQQVKELVGEFYRQGIGHEFVGFANARMAYDDVIARFCGSFELGTLAAKITSGTLTQKYRANAPFSSAAVDRCREAITRLGSVRPFVEGPVRLNKATLYSWLWFLGDTSRFLTDHRAIEHLGRFFFTFEHSREDFRDTGGQAESTRNPPEFPAILLAVYNDRASARVADVTSVLARDVVLWLTFALYSRNKRWEVVPPEPKRQAFSAVSESGWSPIRTIADISGIPDWGQPL
jgi:hypothetical protein